MSEDPSLLEDLSFAEKSKAAFGDPRAVVLRWRVPPEFVGCLADQYLAMKVKRLSRSRAARIIQEGDFRRPREALKPGTRMQEEMVELWRIPPDSPAPLPHPPGVLFEDDQLLVLDKPPDLAVHPSARYLHQTLTRWLRDRASPAKGANPCHRLDRETSGVLLAAKSTDVERELKMSFQRGSIEKTYLAIVRGHLDAPDAVEFPLGLQGSRGLVRIRMIHDEDGLPARTDIAPLYYDETLDRTLVSCRPRTGRQHQIRAHLSLRQHPLVGDKLYAMGDAFFDAFTRGEVPDDEAPLEHPRHALHAYALRFSLHGVEREFRAPFPDDLRKLLPRLAEIPLGPLLDQGAPLPPTP